jgi:capsular exopolysaccharide synthesis family protein
VPKDNPIYSLSEILREPQTMNEQSQRENKRGALDGTPAITELGQMAVEEVEIQTESRLIFATDPRSPGADRFRFLRMRLRELKDKTRLKSLVITSPLPEDGKSTVALNLATALSEGGRRPVLLIEADLHRPGLSRALGITPGPGLASWLEGGQEALSKIKRLEPLKWYFLEAGQAIGNPTEMLQSAPISSLMEELSPLFDWILIDTPPVMPLTDALSLARHVDATLLVIRADKTPKEAVEDAVSLIGPGHLAGIVFNSAERLNKVYAKYAGYYSKR